MQTEQKTTDLKSGMQSAVAKPTPFEAALGERFSQEGVIREQRLHKIREASDIILAEATKVNFALTDALKNVLVDLYIEAAKY